MKPLQRLKTPSIFMTLLEFFQHLKGKTTFKQYFPRKNKLEMFRRWFSRLFRCNCFGLGKLDFLIGASRHFANVFFHRQWLLDILPRKSRHIFFHKPEIGKILRITPNPHQEIQDQIHHSISWKRFILSVISLQISDFSTEASFSRSCIYKYVLFFTN